MKNTVQNSWIRMEK